MLENKLATMQASKLARPSSCKQAKIAIAKLYPLRLTKLQKSWWSCWCHDQASGWIEGWELVMRGMDGHS